MNVSDTEQVGEQNAECERYVQQKTPHHTPWYNDAGVFDLFRCQGVSDTPQYDRLRYKHMCATESEPTMDVSFAS